MMPGFGADAADLLAIDGVLSADVTASIVNDAAKLPAGSAIILLPQLNLSSMPARKTPGAGGHNGRLGPIAATLPWCARSRCHARPLRLLQRLGGYDSDEAVAAAAAAT